MKIIVIGGAGFIGSHLTNKLETLDNVDVSVVDDLSTGVRSNIFSKLHVFDVRYQTVSWKDILFDADYVFYLAARARVQPSIEDPVGYHTVNVNGLLHILNILKQNTRLKKFIYSSSSSVYGDANIFPTPENTLTHPMSPYALQKLIGEQYVTLYNEIYNIPTVSLRYFNVFGERMTSKSGYQLVMMKFKEQLEGGGHIKITGDGQQQRDFTFVGDVIEANILAAFSDVENEIINVGSGYPVSINTIADIIDKEHNRKYISPVIEPMITYADNTKAKKLLGWKPTVKVEDWWRNYVDSKLYT